MYEPGGWQGGNPPTLEKFTKISVFSPEIRLKLEVFIDELCLNIEKAWKNPVSHIPEGTCSKHEDCYGISLSKS